MASLLEFVIAKEKAKSHVWAMDGLEMEKDTENVLILRNTSKTMNRQSFLFSMLGLIAFQTSDKPTKLDMKDKHNFNIYLHELAHKINQINKNDSFRSIC
jgi:hypothetical protein